MLSDCLAPPILSNRKSFCHFRWMLAKMAGACG